MTFNHGIPVQLWVGVPKKVYRKEKNMSYKGKHFKKEEFGFKVKVEYFFYKLKSKICKYFKHK